MYLDINDQIASNYAPTSTGTTTSGTYIDRLVAMEEGAGTPLYFYGLVTAAVTSGGAATVQFNLLGNPSDPTFTSGNVVVITGTAIAKASLGLQAVFAKQVVPRFVPTANSLETQPNFLRYWTLQVVIGTAALTAGSFSAWLTNGPIADNMSYGSGFSV